MLGIDPRAAAQRVFRLPNSSKQSALALRQGRAFERVQCEDGGARLLQALQQAEVLGKKDVRVLDLTRAPASSSPISGGSRRTLETERALSRKNGGSADAPNVILQAHLRLPLGYGAAIVRPDLLIARSSEAMYRVGDIKSIAFLGHLTDEQDVADASAQCGVYGVALEATLRRLGFSGGVPTEAVLVLRQGGGLYAKAALQPIGRYMEAARRVLEQHARSLLQELERVLGPELNLDTAKTVLRLTPKFTGACRSFCPLSQACVTDARAQSTPSVLGKHVEDAIGAVGSIRRASALLAGEAPANEVEREIQHRLLTYRRELAGVVE